MRFIVDADLPRATGPLLRRYGHEAVDVRDIGMGAATDPEIAAHARARGLAIPTGDFGFADIRAYPPDQYAGLIVLQLRNGATAPVILDLVESFLQQRHVLSRMPGRLAIVESSRIRLRPA